MSHSKGATLILSAGEQLYTSCGDQGGAKLCVSLKRLAATVLPKKQNYLDELVRLHRKKAYLSKSS